LTLKCLGLSCITLEDNVDFFQNFLDTLLTLIHEETQTFPTEIKATAIKTLTIGWFMVLNMAEPPPQYNATTTMIMDGLELLFHAFSSKHDLCSYALNGWNLLLTTLCDARVIRELFLRNIAKLMDHLNSSDVEIRDASSKSIALLVELMKDGNDEDGSTLESIVSPVDWTEVLDKLNTLFGDKSNYVSKLERQKHRSVVHQIIKYLENDVPPGEEIVIRNFQLHLDNWRHIIQMQGIRSAIGEGFLIHLAENPTLMKIFDYYIDASLPFSHSTMSKRERRFSFGPSSQAAKATTKVKSALRCKREKEQGIPSLLEEVG